LTHLFPHGMIVNVIRASNRLKILKEEKTP